MKKSFKFYWEEPYEKTEPSIKIEVPGYHKNEITVKLNGNLITVNASRKAGHSRKGENFYSESSFSSSFSRSMSLPYNIKKEDFDITIKDGEVTLKKKKLQ